MRSPHVSFEPSREDSTSRRPDAARLVFVSTAIIFALIGVATAVWISRANMADPFSFGTTDLWRAMDPAGLYFADVILFFESDPVEHVFHPGLPMTLAGALVARSVYAAHSLFADGGPYVDYWVRHRMLLNGMLAGLANAMLLACCHPLFLVIRQLMDRSVAYVSCALFLCSVPVLLYVSRFSPEAWMLYFTLWSVHLSLRAVGGEGDVRSAAAMGASTSLAVLSKWLSLPLVALNVYSLLASRAPNAKELWSRIGAYGVSAAVVAVALLSKVSIPHLLEGLVTDSGQRLRLVTVWSLPYERPFLVHHVLVFCFGGLGLIVIHRLQSHARQKLTALVGTVALMALLTSPRPFWHYFFGFYWFFPAAAASGLTLLLGRRFSGRRDAVAVAAGLVVVAVCDAWQYPGIVGTYGRYLHHFRERAALVREHPAWVAAPWELTGDGFEATRDPSRVFSVAPRLDATLYRQREHEDTFR